MFIINKSVRCVDQEDSWFVCFTKLNIPRKYPSLSDNIIYLENMNTTGSVFRQNAVSVKSGLHRKLANLFQ